MSSKTNAFNSYETTLNGGITDSATSLTVIANPGPLNDPAFMVLEPDDPVLREVIRIGTIAGTAFSSITRGLPGSASGAQAHVSGAVIRSTPVHQMWDDVFADVIALEAALHSEDHEARHGEGGADVLASIANGGYLPGIHVYFLVDGTFTKADHTGLRAIRVRSVGGGGGGGGAAEGSASETSFGAGGGGAAYAEKFILASALAANETVTVGEGGVGGSTSGGDGTAGEDTSFGGYVIAKAGNLGTGGPGVALSTSAIRSGGLGGLASASTGDLKMDGGNGFGAGHYPHSTPVSMARGGDSILGFGGGRYEFFNSGSDNVAWDGTGYGAGGEGAAQNSSPGNGMFGGEGADGIVIVELFF